MLDLLPWKLAAITSGVRRDYVEASFRSGKKLFHARVPSRDLFVAIKDILVFEEYELYSRFKLRNLPANATVIDAGAYVGLFSLKASPFAKRVVSVEPSRRNYSTLLQNIEANSVTNIEPRQVALSSGKSMMGFRELGNGSSLVTTREMASYDVATVGLRELVEATSTVELLKLDVEGAEYDILLNSDLSTLARVRRLVAELHFFEPHDKERLGPIITRLKESGMKVEILNKPFESPTYGIRRPWSCSLSRLDGRYAFPYRLFLSIAYGMNPLLFPHKLVQDAGGLSLMFAHRE